MKHRSNSEYQQAWYQKNKAAKQKYAAENKEKIRAYRQEYYQRNKDF